MVSERMAIRAIRHLVAERMGLEFPEGRTEDLRVALADAMEVLALGNLEVLYERLEEAGLEASPWPLLRRRLTVGETYFCRDAAQLNVIREHILRPLAERGGPRRLRLWSAGCSTGEEAFTLAIMAQGLFPEGLGWQVEVLGTDLDPAAVERARAATYRDWSFRGVEPGFREQWFHQTRAGWTVLPELQRRVRFAVHNLAADPFEPLAEGEGFDLILCRNVLIYFQGSTRRELLGRFLKALKPSGALVIGHNELEPHARRALHVEHL